MSEGSVLLEYDFTLLGNRLPTFRGNVLSSRVEVFQDFGILSRLLGDWLPTFRLNVPISSSRAETYKNNFSWIFAPWRCDHYVVSSRRRGVTTHKKGHLSHVLVLLSVQWTFRHKLSDKAALSDTVTSSPSRIQQCSKEYSNDSAKIQTFCQPVRWEAEAYLISC